MSRLGSVLKLLGGELPLWLLGALFIAAGVFFAGIGLHMALTDFEWSQARTTTGRVMLTEWKRTDNESRLAIVYGYQDEHGVIYHNSSMLARNIGKINLEPAAPVLVRYKPEDHSKAKMQLELGNHDWIPILIIGPIEILAGALFLTVAIKRLLEKMSEKNAGSETRPSISGEAKAIQGKGAV